MPELSRRDVVLGAAALSVLATLPPAAARAFPTRPGEVVIPWLDQPAENPVPQVIMDQLVWEDWDSWITPNEKFFSIAHFDRPVIDAATWSMEVGGMVTTPMRLTLADIQARPREEVTFTIECSGNTGLPFFDGGVGNALWAGTPLAPLLEEAGVMEGGKEVAFWGTDSGEMTVRDIPIREHFARSMSLEEAMAPGNLLAWEMNGEPLPAKNGFPLRLIAPGWYGIANVKWLSRIEVRDRRLQTNFMSREYVTLREEVREGGSEWVETLVGPALLKSVPAKVTRAEDGHRILGAAWGGDVAKVEVRIDDGPWQEARLDESERAPHAWVVWHLDWPDASAGEHRVTSRATDAAGNVQPAPDDPWIANKHTYWESNGQVTRRVMIEA